VREPRLTLAFVRALIVSVDDAILHILRMKPLVLSLLAMSGVAYGQEPVRRSVSDPGVIATGQRVNPTGVQSVFDGKVAGLRFGKTSDELWVAVPGNVYRVDWRAGTVRARARVDGRPGVYGVAIDPVTNRVFASSVGRLPVAPTTGTRRPAVANINVFDPDARGDSAQPAFNSGALGDFMAGSIAVAAKAGADGKRLAVAALPANDSLVVLDAASGAVIRKIGLGVEPIGAVISADSRVAYVSILGGARPKPGELSSMQCCDARSEALRVDKNGIALPGSVAKVDLVAGSVSRDISVGRHPTSIVWSETSGRLFVAEGNSDSISVIDTKTDAVVSRFAIAPFASKQVGLAPTALALAPDGRTLYVALGGANAVAMYDVSGDATLRGLIPTSWYPSTIDASADGKYLAIGTLYGVGSGTGTLAGQRSRYVFAVRGAVHVLPVPTDAELVAFTTAVAENNRLKLASASISPAAPRAIARAKAVPEQPGDSSLIKHVVFIVKENRTYDQVLGDLDRGSGDSSLAMYGKSVTPNAHALSQQFVTIDHFFASGGNSADGHQWLTQANETDYPMWPLYFGRSYPSEGEDALTYSSGGFLWEGATSKGKTVQIFGEYAPSPKFSSDSVRRRMLAQYFERPKDYEFHRSLLTGRFDTHSDIPSLDRALVREYPGWTQEVPDVVKAGDILWHLGQWEAKSEMPNLTMIILPNDHTQGTSPGWCTPAACVADNDFALGKIVEGLSHSSFWKDMAIFVAEDDAQNGVDHVDGHRTVAMAISPYTKRGTVDSTFYSQPSMVKTVELMLGIASMSIFDLVATDMRASFIDAEAKPDITPYTAIEPQQSLVAVNSRLGSINGKFAPQRRDAARASQRMSFDGPDEAPTEILNRILWREAKGWDAKYPTVRRSLFFPLSVDIADEDREKRDPKKKRDR
jgi:DNA-binding beta-propeller fold protein YncE